MRNMHVLMACIHIHVALVYICRVNTESVEVEYNTNVTLSCNYSAHGLSYQAQPDLVPIRRYWILPKKGVLQDSFSATHKWYISRPDFSLNVVSVGDSDFGVYFCAILWNNWDYRLDVIRVGLNEDGPLDVKLQKYYVRRVMIGGIIAGSVSLVVAICCCCSYFRRRNDIRYNEPKLHVRTSTLQAGAQGAGNLHIQVTDSDSVKENYATAGHNKLWKNTANERSINHTARHNLVRRGRSTDIRSAYNDLQANITRGGAISKGKDSPDIRCNTRRDEAVDNRINNNVVRYETNDKWTESTRRNGTTWRDLSTDNLTGNTRRFGNATDKSTSNHGRHDNIEDNKSSCVRSYNVDDGEFIILESAF